MEQYPKYRASEPVAIENRVWPTRRITRPGFQSICATATRRSPVR